jgi:hypothetical protein
MVNEKGAEMMELTSRRIASMNLNACEGRVRECLVVKTWKREGRNERLEFLNKKD